MSIIWNTGPAAERARHNLKLNKKIKRTRGPKLQALRRRQAAWIRRQALDKGSQMM